jgi:uncharacterized Tic20 family protein
MSQEDKKKYDYKGQENYEFSMAAVSVSIIAMILIFVGYAIGVAISKF